MEAEEVEKPVKETEAAAQVVTSELGECKVQSFEKGTPKCQMIDHQTDTRGYPSFPSFLLSNVNLSLCAIILIPSPLIVLENL